MMKTIKVLIILTLMAVCYLNIGKLKSDYHSEIDPIPLSIPCKLDNLIHTCHDRTYGHFAKIKDKCSTKDYSIDTNCLTEYLSKEN